MKNKEFINELNKSRLPIVAIDERLNKYRGKILFPEKQKLANEILSKSRLPTIKNK